MKIAVKNLIKHNYFWPIALFCLLLLAVFGDHLYYMNRIYHGVYLKGLSLGGCSFVQLEHALSNIEVTFTGPGDRKVMLPLKKMGIFPAAEQVFSFAYRQGRQNEWPYVYADRVKLINNGFYLPLLYRLDEEQLRYTISLLENTFSFKPVNAYFFVSDSGQTKIIPEKPGFDLKKEGLQQILLQSFSDSRTPFVVAVPVETIPAEITVEIFRERGIESLISSFTTVFDLAKTDRVHNIKLAASIIDNYFLAPGEVFSLNSVIGDTTPDKGYKEAPIIVAGDLVPGYGGGLCQISTTLYNAALLANLEIIERHNHQLTVPYVPPGIDATVSYPAKDLKFQNNSNQFILINAFVEQDNLTFRLFGLPVEEKVVIETKILETYPPSVIYESAPDLLPGEEEEIPGYPGYLVEVWKTIYHGEQIKSKEKISLDSYQPYPTVIRRAP